MKINETQRIGAINPYRRSGESRPEEASGKKGKRKDEVQISPEAKELMGSDNPKIKELKQAVATGTYHVDARKVAEKLFPYIR